MIRRLAHLCFVTNDLDAMVDFYTRGLGLPVKFTMTNTAGNVFGYYIDCGDSTFIEIFDQAGMIVQWGGQARPLQAGNRYAHLCLEVTGLSELKAALEARGVSVGDVSQGMDGSMQAWTKDPDGNAIELMEYTYQSQQLQR